MKKSKKNLIFKLIFSMAFMCYLVIYFSYLSGYYEYQNHSKTALTEEQIRKFEEDVASGKEVDINEYLIIEERHYNNKLSKVTSTISDGISSIVQTSVQNTFNFLSHLMEE